MPRSDQYFLPQDLDNTPQFGLLRVPNKENQRVTVTLFDGRMASVVTEHNFTAQISIVWLTLAFSLVKMRPRELNFILISGLMQLDFPADFFKPK